MSKVLFKEEQKFKQPWIWLIIIPIISFYIYFMFIIRTDTSTIEGDDFVGYVIICAVLIVMMVGLTVLFYKMKLITSINKDGIHILFPPQLKKKRYIPRTEISRYEIIDYYHKGRMKGYSLKSKLKNTAKAYTLAGKYGLVIYLANRKRVLIDTNRKEAVRLAMNKLMNQE